MPCGEFRDGFLLQKSLIVNKGLLSHVITAQSRDSTYASSMRTHPVALGNKSKDSMINETTCANDINNREDLTILFEAYSKLHKSFMHAVLYMQFASID